MLPTGDDDGAETEVVRVFLDREECVGCGKIRHAKVITLVGE